jgi:ribonucleoside-diphosphate reductase alpha chain
VKYKKLVRGGAIRMVNKVVRSALGRLGYGEQQARDILDYVERNATIEGAPHLKPEHLPVFDCSRKPANGQRSIQPMGHVRMMAAVQPFLSGAISKTVNLPSDATIEDIAEVFLGSWRNGLKAIAVYRDASKQTQPLNTGQVTKRKEVEVSAETTKAHRQEEGEAKVPTTKPTRRRLPDERQALTHHFSVGGYEGYLMVGFYEDGQPGELFIRMAKAGSTIAGLMDSFGIAVSLALQYGLPL